jgi:hypothetical protein
LEEFWRKTPYISYDIYGSVTGRLTTKPNSFPILILKKEIADIVVPKNDAFIQFDFNGAEIELSYLSPENPNPRKIYMNLTQKYLNVLVTKPRRSSLLGSIIRTKKTRTS